MIPKKDLPQEIKTIVDKLSNGISFTFEDLVLILRYLRTPNVARGIGRKRIRVLP